jgi:hypothetical protein
MESVAQAQNEACNVNSNDSKMICEHFFNFTNCS